LKNCAAALLITFSHCSVRPSSIHHFIVREREEHDPPPFLRCNPARYPTDSTPDVFPRNDGSPSMGASLAGTSAQRTRQDNELGATRPARIEGRSNARCDAARTSVAGDAAFAFSERAEARRWNLMNSLQALCLLHGRLQGSRTGDS
jgi:hypothetical protein